jgi:hypothetical protein
MGPRYARWLFVIGFLPILACLPACGLGTSVQPTYAVTLSDVVAEPAVVTTETPVVLKFKVVCNKTTGSGSLPFVGVATEAYRGEILLAGTEVNCRANPGQPWTSMPWVGDGQITLGRLASGKQVIKLVVPSKAAGWNLPAPEKITIEVVEAPN